MRLLGACKSGDYILVNAYPCGLRLVSVHRRPIIVAYWLWLS
jgi:hypothetical protein